MSSHSARLFIRNKTIWKVFLALLMIILFLYFVKNEHVEVKQIGDNLRHAEGRYILGGILTTLVYIALQGLMYVYSFRSIHLRVSLADSIVLFLKRNFISVFLPAGGVSSLAFFTRSLVKKGMNKTQIYYASFIYAITGILTVIVIAVPAIFSVIHSNQRPGVSVIYYILILTVFIVLVVVAFYFVVFKEVGAGFISRIWPDFLISMDNLRSYTLSFRDLLLVIGISLLIEIVGVLQLFIGLKAVGIPATLSLALIGYVLMIVFLILSPFLRGLGAIEVSLTLLLTHYGFTTIQAASGMLLFRFFEFWIPLLAGLLIFLVKPGKIIIRILPATLLFILGLVNILSAITPAIPERIHLLTHYLPKNLVETSNFFVLGFGIILLVNSFFLLRRLKSAWWVALFISVLSLLGHITKGIDYEESSLALLVIVTLLVTYKEYIFKSIIIVNRHFFYMTTGIGLAVLLGNTLGFFYLEKLHFNQDFSLYQSFLAVVETFRFNNSTLETQTPFAQLFLYWIRLSGIGFTGLLFYGILRPKYKYIQQLSGQSEAAQSLVKQYGDSPLDYFKTYQDKLLFFPDDIHDGFVSYKLYKGVAVVLENPVCPPEKKKVLLQQFDAFCAQMDYIYFIYRVPEETLSLYKDLGMRYIPVGQEATVDLEKFSLEGREMKSIRNALSKVERSGYKVTWCHPPIPDGKLQQLQQVSDEWLAIEKRSELVFSQGLFLPSEIKNNLVLTVENDEGRIVGFLNIIPDYKKDEGTYDLVRKTKDAPNGINDYMIIKMFEYFNAESVRYVNLGMVAISGKEFENKLVTRAFTLLSKIIHRLSEFKGQREFKEKFKPLWKTQYLIYKNDFDLILLPRVLSEIMKPEE